MNNKIKTTILTITAIATYILNSILANHYNTNATEIDLLIRPTITSTERIIIGLIVSVLAILLTIVLIAKYEVNQSNKAYARMRRLERQQYLRLVLKHKLKTNKELDERDARKYLYINFDYVL